MYKNGFAIVLLVFVLVLSTNATAVSLPDYETEAEIIAEGKCDNGETKFYVYNKQDEYKLEVAFIKHDTYYLLMADKDFSPRFFIKKIGETDIREYPQNEWMQLVANASKNFFADMYHPGKYCEFKLLKDGE